MPDRIARRLRSRYGEDLVRSRKVHVLEVPVPDGIIEACYDPYNRRLKLFDLPLRRARLSSDVTSALAGETPNTFYDKILVYARPSADFGDLGLRHEATIRGFHRNGEHAELWARYLDPDRAAERNKARNENTYAIARAKKTKKARLPSTYTSLVANVEEAAEISALMSATFADYPTPITADIIRNNIQRGASYFRTIRNADHELVACASAEIQLTRRTAELTDCSTRDDHRGRGLMSWLLGALRDDLQADFGITDVFTLARAGEIGMNCSFAKLGYTYTGRLVNNCRMPDGWESMNVWCGPSNCSPS